MRRIPLILKLLSVQGLVVLLVIVAVWLSMDLLAADYFMTLMKKYDIEPTDVHEMFVSAHHRTLIQVGIVAIVVAAVLCFWLTRRILAPINTMLESTRRITAGQFDSVSVVTTRDELGELARSFATMAESLARDERLRKNMIVDVAHELRTPLSNLQGLIEALQDGLIAPDREVLAQLHDELLRLIRLTEDLLSTARQEARKLSDKRLDLAALVSKSMQLFEARFAGRGIEIRTSTPDKPLILRGDPDRLHQVLANLFENVLQYAPAGSWLDLRLTEEHGRARCAFCNPGDGITAADLPWIFEAYYRTDRSRSREQGGAGVGLAIVKAIVEAHGGQVGATSNAEETCIWFEVPAAAAP